MRHIKCLIAEHLAQQKLAAPVPALTLQSLVTEPLADAAAATTSLSMEDRQQSGSTLELVERLSPRLGRNIVCVWQPGANHQPEDMQQWLPAQNAIESIATKAVKTVTSGIKRIKTRPLSPASPENCFQDARTDTGTDVRTDALYPSWLLPEPVALRSVGNSPVYQGRLQRLAGPQRLESCGWWMASYRTANPPSQRARPPAIRDYFIYGSEQVGLLWIYNKRLIVNTHFSLADTPPG